jgi:hypothetical protein
MSVISLVVTLYSLLEPQIAKKRNDHPKEVTEGLFALSCGPDLRVRFSTSCIVNGVRYNTVDHEKYLQTQNSGVLTEGTHDDQATDFYGVLNEIIELQYNVNLQCKRTVVLFRCDWYNQAGGKTIGIRDNGHFKSINIQLLWYKSDPFILATQSTKVFYMEDTALGKNWRVVQKFEHREMYNVAEKSDLAQDVYQDDHCSSTDNEVQQGDSDGAEVEHINQGGGSTRFEGSLDELIRKSRQANIIVDEDDTILEYLSDGGNENAEDDMCQDADNEDDDL